MTRSHKEATNCIQKFVIFYHKDGNSIRGIAKLVNLSHPTVQYGWCSKMV
ncbi:hypothetical protein X975_11248, partial [Stegodyphus mimosarum]